MAKATTNTGNNPFQSFDPESMTEQFRAFAENGIKQTQDAYAKMKTQAEEGQRAMEESMETMRGAVQVVSKTTIENARAQSEAAFDHVEKLLAVTSLSELVEVQSAFIRKQAEMSVEQAKQMQTVTTDAFEQMSKPAKDAMSKAMDNANAGAAKR